METDDSFDISVIISPIPLPSGHPEGAEVKFNFSCLCEYELDTNNSISVNVRNISAVDVNKKVSQALSDMLSQIRVNETSRLAEVALADTSIAENQDASLRKKESEDAQRVLNKRLMDFVKRVQGDIDRVVDATELIYTVPGLRANLAEIDAKRELNARIKECMHLVCNLKHEKRVMVYKMREESEKVEVLEEKQRQSYSLLVTASEDDKPGIMESI